MWCMLAVPSLLCLLPVVPAYCDVYLPVVLAFGIHVDIAVVRVVGLVWNT